MKYLRTLIKRKPKYEKGKIMKIQKTKVTRMLAANDTSYKLSKSLDKNFKFWLNKKWKRGHGGPNNAPFDKDKKHVKEEVDYLEETGKSDKYKTIDKLVTKYRKKWEKHMKATVTDLKKEVKVISKFGKKGLIRKIESFIKQQNAALGKKYKTYDTPDTHILRSKLWSIINEIYILSDEKTSTHNQIFKETQR